MSCPNAAGTITGSPLLEVSITDRSATCSRCTAVHFMWALHGSPHFLLSYYWRICLVTEPLASPGQLKWCCAATRTQSLEEQPLPFKPERAQTLPLWRTHAHTAACPHMVNTLHLSNVRASNHWLTCLGQEDGLSVKRRSGSSLYLWEFISSPNTLL